MMRFLHFVMVVVVMVVEAERDVTDGGVDGETDRPSYRNARTRERERVYRSLIV